MKWRQFSRKGAALALTACLTACQSTPQTEQTTLRADGGPASVIPETPVPLEERAQPVAVEDAGAGAAIPLTRDGALLTALVHNRTIEVSRLGPQIADTSIPEARAAFDPMLSATLSYGRSTSPSSSSSFGGSTYSGSGSSAGISTGTASVAALASSISQSLSRIQTSLDTLDQTRNRGTDRDLTQGDISVQQLLPTGTLLFLTGEGSDTDTEALDRDYRGGWSLGVRQALLEGAGLAPNLVALRQARNQASQSREAFRSDVLDIASQTELAYWDLALAAEVLKIREFALQLADEQLRQDEELLRVGKAIEGDVMASRAERASRKADLTDAQAAIRTGNIALVRLLNPEATDPWLTTFAPIDPPDVAEVQIEAAASEEWALQYRPELAQARLEVANAGLSVVSAKNARLPQLDLVGAYGRSSQGSSSSGIGRHLDDDYYDDYSIGIEFQTPLLNRAEKARHLRARLTSDRADRSLAELEQLVAADVRRAAVEVEKQWQRLASTHEAVQSREEQLRVAQGRYAVGKTSNLDLLIVQRDYIQAQVDEVTAKVRYIQALTDLYTAEGTLLERRGIRVDEVAGESD